MRIIGLVIVFAAFMSDAHAHTLKTHEARMQYWLKQAARASDTNARRHALTGWANELKLCTKAHRPKACRLRASWPRLRKHGAAKALVITELMIDAELMSDAERRHYVQCLLEDNATCLPLGWKIPSDVIKTHEASWQLMIGGL